MTLDFGKKSGFVLDATPTYLEVRWVPSGVVERLTGIDAENVLRVAHADALCADGAKTNVELMDEIEALRRVDEATQKRIAAIKTQAEQNELDKLSRRFGRACKENCCKWDLRHRKAILQMIIAPEEVSLIFKCLDPLHRLFCGQHER